MADSNAESPLTDCPTCGGKGENVKKQREVTERDRLSVMERLRRKAIWPEVEVDNG